MRASSRRTAVDYALATTPTGPRPVRPVPVVVFPHPAHPRLLVMITHTGEAFVGRRGPRSLVWEPQSVSLPQAA